MSQEKIFFMLRHDEDELSATVEDIQSKLTEKGIVGKFVRVDPSTASEMDTQCKEQNVWDVLLPMEVPIPTLAMKRGVRFIVRINGKLMRLVDINPVFEEHEP